MNWDDEVAMSEAVQIAQKHRKAIHADTKSLKQAVGVCMVLLWSFCRDLEKKGQGPASEILRLAVGIFLSDKFSKRLKVVTLN